MNSPCPAPFDRGFRGQHRRVGPASHPSCEGHSKRVSRFRSVQTTFPWSWYADAEVLRREQDRIFRGAWQYVAHLGELEEPGRFVARRVGEVPLFLVRDREGDLQAFANVCRHRGARVAKGDGKRETLQCGYHAWTYGLDGSLLAAPRSDREAGFDTAELSLLPAQRVDGGGQLEARLRELPRVLPLPGCASRLQRARRRRSGRVPTRGGGDLLVSVRRAAGAGALAVRGRRGGSAQSVPLHLAEHRDQHLPGPVELLDRADVAGVSGPDRPA